MLSSLTKMTEKIWGIIIYYYDTDIKLFFLHCPRMIFTADRSCSIAATVVVWYDSAKFTYFSDGSIDLRVHMPKKAVKVKFQHFNTC